jgi:hypothetical protein
MSTPITRETLRALPNKVYSDKELQALALGYAVENIYTQVIYSAKCGRTTQTFYPNLRYCADDDTPVTVMMDEVIEKLEKLFPDSYVAIIPVEDDEPTGLKISW